MSVSLMSVPFAASVFICRSARHYADIPLLPSPCLPQGLLWPDCMQLEGSQAASAVLSSAQWWLLGPQALCEAASLGMHPPELGTCAHSYTCRPYLAATSLKCRQTNQATISPWQSDHGERARRYVAAKARGWHVTYHQPMCCAAPPCRAAATTAANDLGQPPRVLVVPEQRRVRAPHGARDAAAG